MRVAINGCGRIGRLVLRSILEREDIEIVAVNDLCSIETIAYLLVHDSVHGPLSKQVSFDDTHLIIEGERIQYFSESDPTKLPWRELEVDYVVEATGRFTSLEEGNKHIQAGARRVLVTAPGKNISTFVMGVNEADYNPTEHFVISNASCTTNCLAPLAKILNEQFGIVEGLMTTIHAYTATQALVDAPVSKTLRDTRAAALNVIPSTTGAAKAVAQVIPELEGKLTGMAFRVPVPDVSVVDLTVKLEKSTSYEEICQSIKLACDGPLQNIYGYTEEDVASTDFISCSLSGVFDKGAGIGLNETFYKLVAWYDNEWGYSHRAVDLLRYIARQE